MNILTKISAKLNLPSPLEKLASDLFEKENLNVYIKREELIHQDISGNKWRKLKYNLIEANKQNKKHIISFGGPFSNHIVAVSAACAILDLKLTLFVRGTFVDPNNPSLRLCKSYGAKLIHLDKKEYGLKQNSEMLKDYLGKLNDFYLIPEGGSNELALKGVGEMLDEIAQELRKVPDYILVSAGTGGTAAGIISNQWAQTKCLVFNALKHDGLRQELEQLIPLSEKCFELFNNYHWGGFAKSNPELIAFSNHFKNKFKITLDPVYTAKLFYGFYDLIEKKYFPKNSTIVLIHTGGLQGAFAHNYRYRKSPEMQLDLS